MIRAELNPAIDTGQPHRRVTFAIDAEKNVGMRLAKTGKPRAQPEFDKVHRGSNVQFLSALKVKLAGRSAKLGKCAFQVGQRGPELERGANAGAAAYDKFDAKESSSVLTRCPAAAAVRPSSSPVRLNDPVRTASSSA